MGACLWAELSRHGLSQGSLSKLCRTKKEEENMELKWFSTEISAMDTDPVDQEQNRIWRSWNKNNFSILSPKMIKVVVFLHT